MEKGGAYKKGKYAVFTNKPSLLEQLENKPSLEVEGYNLFFRNCV